MIKMEPVQIKKEESFPLLAQPHACTWRRALVAHCPVTAPLLADSKSIAVRRPEMTSVTR